MRSFGERDQKERRIEEEKKKREPSDEIDVRGMSQGVCAETLPHRHTESEMFRESLFKHLDRIQDTPFDTNTNTS